jgi:predicted O-linked N-acetylglucosamine transferase (SPINDLY family)
METSWHPQSYPLLLAENYAGVAAVYEQILQNEPEEATHYWYLGLAYLLQNQEEDAQATWLAPTLEASEEQLSAWIEQLQFILEAEAQRQESLEHQQLSWLIRGHFREMVPGNINNLLHLLRLSLETQVFSIECLQAWDVIETIQSSEPNVIDFNLLLEILSQILEFVIDFSETEVEAITLCQVCQQCIPQPKALIPTFIQSAQQAFYLKNRSTLAIELMKLCVEIDPENLLFLYLLFYFHYATNKFEPALAFARLYAERSHNLANQVSAHKMLLQTLLVMGGGCWQEAMAVNEQLKSLLHDLVQLETLKLEEVFPLISAPFSFNYIEDDLAKNRWFQNQVSCLAQRSVSTDQKNRVQSFRKVSAIRSSDSRRLKIGYVSHHFSRHSIGWLCRWLFQHHNREDFHISLYLMNQPINEFTQQWFIDKADSTFHLESPDPVIAAQKIAEDAIDILIDLESVTVDGICHTMALKPAPVQVTWLGADASGLPAIDYFIADPYVLPEDAQAHYQETLWRLPNTYIAVDGFEVDAPTLRREHLNIPEDAIIYFTSQTGHKRHPALAKLQLKILKEVANSYLLIKGRSDEESVQTFFIQIAEAEGVNPDRLRFLASDPTSAIHRANLQIADVVLDTYPYNGATTTLEVLWMGIPLVTRVGEQFAARNSYAFMTNAGLTEGIAWTDAEYIEWGIRFGMNEALRQQVSWKLKTSRHSSPLWNAKQFTREMENAYQQMWERYSHHS